MTTPNEASRMGRIYDLICKNGSINRYDLEDMLRMSTSLMNQIKPKLMRRYRMSNVPAGKPYLEYDKSSMSFIAKETEVI